MRSIDIDSGNTSAQSSRLTGLGRKLCGCCSTKSSKANPVQLTKAEAITNQPTSSNISVARKDVFNENLANDNFYSVELQVPRERDDERPQTNSNSRANRSEDARLKEDSSRITNAVLDRIINESDEVDRETSEKIDEEVTPDIELTDIVEEANESDLHEVAKKETTTERVSHGSTENKEINDEEIPTARTSSSPEANARRTTETTNEKTPLPANDDQQKQLQASEKEEEEPQIASETRAVELNEKQSTSWSPVKPPRRASQLVAKDVPENKVGASSEAPEDQITEAGKAHVRQEDSTDFPSGSDDDDRTPSEIPYVQLKSKVNDAIDDEVQEETATKRYDTATPASDADVESDGEQSQSHHTPETLLTNNKPKQSNQDEIVRDQNNISGENRTSERKGISRMYASCSTTSEESVGEENVTRVSVKSNGEATVSAITLDGEFIKVRLASTTDNPDVLTDEEFNERLI